MKIDCKIHALDFVVNGFNIRDGSYDAGQENGTITKITPEIQSSADYKEHLIHVYIDNLSFLQGSICEIKTLSNFSIQFPMPYRIFNHFSTDFLINMFSQFFLYANGQVQGVFKERTKGTPFESFITHIKFEESLYLITKDILSTL